MTAIWETEDYQQFLARIRERPDDDVVRLVFADWLEERGEGERAEFVRVQCELANVQAWRVPHNGGTSTGPDPAKMKRERLAELKMRERELWASTLTMASTPTGGYPILQGWVSMAHDTLATFDRGFVRAVRAPLASLHGGECVASCHETGNICDGGRATAPNPAFTRECRSCHGTGRTHGVLPLLLRREPIGCAGIEVTDFQPIQIGGGSWSLAQWRLTPGQRDLAASLPYETFPTADSARLALSRALYSIHAPKIEVSR